MRRLALTSALLPIALLPLALAPARHAAVASAAQQCPAVVLTCTNSVASGEDSTFDASVDGAASDVKYTYRWEVSAGTVTTGQGTPSLKVDTTGIGGLSVVATVEVTGLPASCTRHASCTTEVIQPIRCERPLDEYGNIPFEDEKARLDNFAIELQNDPAATGYIQCYGGRAGYEGEAQRRCDRAREYISNVRGIAADRIATADGGFKEDLTVTVWVVPSGAKLPQAMPTVDPAEVTILKPRPARKPRGN